MQSNTLKKSIINHKDVQRGGAEKGQAPSNSFCYNLQKIFAWKLNISKNKGKKRRLSNLMKRQKSIIFFLACGAKYSWKSYFFPHFFWYPFHFMLIIIFSTFLYLTHFSSPPWQALIFQNILSLRQYQITFSN